jgi:hypothetical protein
MHSRWSWPQDTGNIEPKSTNLFFHFRFWIRFEIWEEIGASNGEKDCPSLPVRSWTLDFKTSSNRSLSLSDELAEVDEFM